MGFDDGHETFNLFTWVFNLFNMILLAFLVIFVSESVRKLYAISQGYTSEFKLTPIPLLIGFALVVVTRGSLWYFLVPGTMLVNHISGLRVGKFRYGLNHFDLGKIAFSGLIGVMILAVIFKIFAFLFPENMLIYRAMSFCIFYVIANALPIPPLLGHHMLFASRIRYIFIVSFLVVLGYLLFVSNLLTSLIFSIIFSIAFVAVYVFFFEVK